MIKKIAKMVLGITITALMALLVIYMLIMAVVQHTYNEVPLRNTEYETTETINPTPVRVYEFKRWRGGKY